MRVNDIDHSILAKKIIGITPRWVIRWGISLIFFVFVTLGTILSVIKYPVSISDPATLEYELKPVPLTVPKDSYLVRLFNDNPIGIQKGHGIMLLEDRVNKETYEIVAPVTGNLYLTDNWKVQSFITVGKPIGFIVPAPNEHIARISMSAERSENLKIGQKAILKIADSAGTYNKNLDGFIDFIGPGVDGHSFTVNIKLYDPANKYLSSFRSINALDSIHCVATITVDTISYLKYLFHRLP